MNTSARSPRDASQGGRPLRAGVVGLGWAGQQHMAAYDALPGVELVAIAGMEDEPRAALGDRYGVDRRYRDWQELVADGDLDVLSVAVPTFLHAPITIGALDAGIHVLSEKPIARTADEAAGMVDAAHRAGRVLEVAFNHRRRGDIEALKTAIDAGQIGRPYHARAIWLRRAGIPALGSWFTNREMAGGGPLIDIGVHVLDYALHLFGEPRVTAVSAVTHSELGVRGRGGATAAKQQVGSAYEVEDLASLLLRVEGGGSIVIETSWAAYRPAGDEFGITLYGTEGGADLRVVDYAPAGELTIFTGEGEETQDVQVTADPGRGHLAVVETFLEHVRDEDHWAGWDGSLALDRARVIDAAYESARIGAEVRLDPPTTGTGGAPGAASTAASPSTSTTTTTPPAATLPATAFLPTTTDEGARP
ncbi:Gfo/Idh/MocA family oxidoreductase [Leifsonia sp. F6_8S_P_1B]|uniref:Gfo/Idh/MocA family oxidoreductase n=1 Tax=Leifsonia williamsii TaxID=3035919 RepID=A0ABT8K9T6_9MICO|nr:Gfo/Idh/MocA family oxidoreductase [Leifsonia williamsii]MDN4614208.1 Gfo/Idh/MocA family oxidoreductase [Leifsonia williamsii]